MEKTVSSTTIEHIQPCLFRTLRLLGDTWTLMIVYNLMSGTKRFGELLDALGNISPKTLSQRLKVLEEINFLERQAFAEIPPRVEYRLTEKGLALVDIMRAIKEFGEKYLADVNEPVSPCTTHTLESEQGPTHTSGS
jgi:DNA-binding HxlR family transcriptional regulator